MWLYLEFPDLPGRNREEDLSSPDRSLLGERAWIGKGKQKKGRESMGLSISSSLFICSLLLLLQPSLAIYCDEDDCYDLLGYSTKYPSLLLLISLFSFFSFSNLLLVLVGFRRVPMPRRSRKLITSSPSNSTPLLLPPFQATFITFFFFF